jgi:aspartate racemase
LVKHIGIIACSAEGAALCYRTICAEAQNEMGEYAHPEVTMHTHPLSEYTKYIVTGNWRKVADLMLSSTEKVLKAGADFAICPDNTIHQAFEYVIEDTPIPWLHIAKVVAEEAERKHFSKVGILGTKYLMTSSVYPKYLREKGIAFEIPDEPARERINQIIFGELVNGVFKEESRLYFNQIITKFKERGSEAAVLGCTEIPLIVDPSDSSLPTLDSTRLLARAAIKHALLD